MALDVFGFFAIVFAILGITAGVALIVLNIKKNNIQVGDLVRTTFSGCPAALTIGMFGVNGEYATSATYGFNFDEDSANALHCDMPKGVGTFSTWLSDGGQNFKIIPWATNSQLYIFQDTCTQNSDCETLTLPCGPDYVSPAGVDPYTGKAIAEGTSRRWNPLVDNPAITQCPASSYCDVCPGPPDQFPRCPNPTAGVGNCKVTTPKVVFSCTQPYASVSGFYCGVALPVDINNPPINRYNSCSIANNYASITIVQPGFPPVTCGSVTAVPKPYFCQFQGNPACLQGQTCVTNTSAGSGWCPPGGGCGSLSTASFVCSGTVYPNVALQTTWIAEGTVESITANGRYNIQWNRIQNTYPGIGPSYDACNTGTTNCRDADTDYTNDNQWLYSDCRFLLQDSFPTASRHFSVSRALMGSPQFNPQGLGIFSVSDASFTNYLLQSLLFVSPTNSGQITDAWSVTGVPEYRRSSWNLQSVAVPKDDIEKIFFYSIHPVEANQDTAFLHSLSYN